MDSRFLQKQDTSEKWKAKQYGEMEKTIIGKSVCRKWIFPILAALLLIEVLIIWQYKKRETEYSSIQAIIEELPDYQDEIESWGYRVSVLPKMNRESDNAGLMRYYWKSAGPVLILEEQNGGMYYFY